MPKIITLSDIKIEYWTVNVDSQFVLARYQILDDQGEVFESQEAYFWVNIPVPGTDTATGEQIPIPDNWYQLPAQHVLTLTELTVDLKAGLLHLIGE